MRTVSILFLYMIIQGCVSRGPYFQLNELEEIVRDRYVKKEVIETFGPTKANFSDKIFVEQGHQVPSSERLLVQDIDGVVFSAVEGDDESDYNHMEFAPGELPKVVAAKDKRSNSNFVTHSSDTVEFNDCTKSVSQLKYISERSDPNGYTERQFAMLLFDSESSVCGYKIRSIFIK